MFFIYGFGPYGDFPDNVTSRIIEMLSPQLRSRSRIFDVVFDREMFWKAFDEARPQLILGLGQSSREGRLFLECRACNMMADRGGSPLPIDACAVEEIRELSWSLPLADLCETSTQPGTYVCNFSMWVAHEWALTHGARTAFIHVPRNFDIQSAAAYVQFVITESEIERPLSS